MKAEFKDMYDKLNLLDSVVCEKEENDKVKEMLSNGEDLPDCYKRAEFDSNIFIRENGTNLSDEELQRLALIKQVLYIKHIRNCFIILIILIAPIFLYLILILLVSFPHFS